MAAIPGKQISAITPVVQPGRPRTTAQVWLDDGRIYEAPVGTPLEAYIRAADGETPYAVPIVAALIDDALRELTYRVEKDVEVIPLSMAQWDGSRVYRRSLTFLLLAAVNELFPGAKINVDHSVTFGGYFCEVMGRQTFLPDELAAIERRMWEIVEADEPITKERVPLRECIDLFRRRGDDDKVRLLAHRRKDYLTLYKLRGMSNYFHGYMVPSAGYLRYFALHHYPPGFILRFPERSNTELSPVVEYPKLIQVFREYGETLHLLEIEDVGALNLAVDNGRTNEIILVAEALHTQRISHIAGADLGAPRAGAAGPDGRSFLFGKDHLHQAAGGAVAGSGDAPGCDRAGRLLRGSREDPARRTGQL